MARPIDRDTPTAWTRMPSGKTVSQEIRSRGGVTGQARGLRDRFTSQRAGTIPFTLEDFIPGEDVQLLKHGDAQKDAVLLDQYLNGKTVNPFAALPQRPTTSQLHDIVTLYDDGGDYYEPDIGETYRNYAQTPIRPGTEKYLGQPEGYTEAAPLSEVPTSTTNPHRPRTVAAGYQINHGEKTGKLTVVFRDGVYYNYYQVTESEWQQFRSNQSKGRYIRQFLDSKPRGVANGSDIDPMMRQRLYRVLETAQRYNKGKLDSARRRKQVTKAASSKSANPRPRNR